MKYLPKCTVSLAAFCISAALPVVADDSKVPAAENLPVCCQADAVLTSDASDEAPNLKNLESIEALKTRFNADAGKTRLLLLLSPTCPMCVNGARWVRENVLEEYPDKEVTVYAVWFNMIPTDRKDRWNPDLLSDSRVTHFWDEERVLGKWISQNIDDCAHLGPIDWDSYYLFDGDGRWEDTLLGMKACGSPIYRETERFEQAARELLGDGTHEK